MSVTIIPYAIIAFNNTIKPNSILSENIYSRVAHHDRCSRTPYKAREVKTITKHNTETNLLSKIV